MPSGFTIWANLGQMTLVKRRSDIVRRSPWAPASSTSNWSGATILLQRESRVIQTGGSRQRGSMSAMERNGRRTRPKLLILDPATTGTMKALVYLGPGKEALEERPKPGITAPTDAIGVSRGRGCGRNSKASVLRLTAKCPNFWNQSL